MKTFRHLLWVTFVVLLTACATPSKINSATESSENTFSIVAVLPSNIEGFVFQSVKKYPDPWGYSLRYEFEANNITYADVYIYPVQKGEEGRSHENIVDTMYNQSIAEIRYATQQGGYSEYSIIKNKSFRVSARKVIRADVFLVKNNLESYSLVFVTESNSKLMKVRMTMTDNESNRKNDNWQRFVESIYAIIINNIDKA
jgi:hypothetical protein